MFRKIWHRAGPTGTGSAPAQQSGRGKGVHVPPNGSTRGFTCGKATLICEDLAGGAKYCYCRYCDPKADWLGGICINFPPGVEEGQQIGRIAAAPVPKAPVSTTARRRRSRRRRRLTAPAPTPPRYEEFCPGYPKSGGVCSTDEAAWGCKTHWRAGKTVCCCPKILVNPAPRRARGRPGRRGAPPPTTLKLGCLEKDEISCWSEPGESGAQYCFCRACDGPDDCVTYPPFEVEGRPGSHLRAPNQRRRFGTLPGTTRGCLKGDEYDPTSGQCIRCGKTEKGEPKCVHYPPKEDVAPTPTLTAPARPTMGCPPPPPGCFAYKENGVCRIRCEPSPFLTTAPGTGRHAGRAIRGGRR